MASPRFVRSILHRLVQKPRVWLYRALSTCERISGTPKLNQPAQLNGKGEIRFGAGVEIGIRQSPHFYNGITYIEARKTESCISFGDAVKINNGACLIAEGEGIEIGAGTLIGTECFIVDSDFHSLDPALRGKTGDAGKTAKVVIGKNVLIGSRVMILKGIFIADGSTIAAGAVVVSSCPEPGIYGGNPAKLLRKL